MKTYVIGDIHGAYKAMMQCFERSGFNSGIDRLICLGDVCDRGPEVSRVFDELLNIDRLVYILGNHDYWAKEWFTTGKIPDLWYYQGGRTTVQSYPRGMPQSHQDLICDGLDGKGLPREVNPEVSAVKAVHGRSLL